jgi:hypothetical protein
MLIYKWPSTGGEIMFENVAKDILRSLNGPKGELVPEPKDGLYLDAAKRLESVSSLADLLGALVALDALVSARITLTMSRYRLDDKISAQPDRSGEALAQARLLLAAYQRVLADPAAAKAVTVSLGPLADRFAVDDKAAQKNERAREFLAAVRQMVLISLAAGQSSGASKLLLDQLATAAAKVKVMVVYKQDPSSFLAFAGGNKTHCKAVRGKTDAKDLTERFQDVEADTGDPSDMAAPVWLTDGKNAGELADASFKYISVGAALEQIFIGSLSFTSTQAPYYSPPRIEILHELVHVLHNARGENRERAAGMTGPEVAAWTNPEEYWAIAGDTVSENALNAQIGAPDRHGHSGLPLPMLTPVSPAAQYTLRQHALRNVK